jgi:molecular chaperone GrpE (heat shock protein)
MDENSNNEDNDFEFGIHLNQLTDMEDALEPSARAETGSEQGEETDADEGANAGADAEEPAEAPGSLEEPPATARGASSFEALLPALEEIRGRLERLSQSFESKIQYDAHKEKVIDELHQALQEHRDGLLKKYLQRVFTDVIKIVDDVRKLTGHYREQPATPENSAKLIQYLEDVAYDLEDIFAWEGVVSFNSDSDVLDPVRQRVVSKIETDDPAKDKMIAERLRPGYEWDGKVIRPEIVAIYVWNRESAADNKEI